MRFPGGPKFCRRHIKIIYDLHPGYRIYRLHRVFYDLEQFRLDLKSLLRQGLTETELYGDLVYKLKKIICSNNFSAQLIKIISRYKKIGYDINVMQRTACLVTVGSFVFLFHCTRVGRTSDSMMVPT